MLDILLPDFPHLPSVIIISQLGKRVNHQLSSEAGQSPGATFGRLLVGLEFLGFVLEAEDFTEVLRTCGAEDVIGAWRELGGKLKLADMAPEPIFLGLMRVCFVNHALLLH